MSRRFQARRGNGRWTPNTLENTFGLHLEVCPHCQRGNPYSVGKPKPETCHACGKPLSAARSPSMQEREK